MHADRRSVALAAALIVAAAAPCAAASLDVEGTEFVLDADGGRVLRSAELIGATLDVMLDDGPAEIRIDAVTVDPRNSAVRLHRLMVRRQGAKDFAEFCDPDPDGARLGFPLRYADGHWGLTCTSGAVGKCVRFGYMPWAKGPDGEALAPYHAACVNMLRGDYCGDDRPMTRNGTRVNIWDRLGLQNRDPAPGLTFEAAFGPEGAVCIAHVRVPQNGSLDQAIAACPRLAQVPTGSACTEAAARALPGPLVFVDSDPAGPPP